MSGASVCLFVDGDGRIFPKCSSVRKVFRKSNHEKEGAAAAFPSFSFRRRVVTFLWLRQMSEHGNMKYQFNVAKRRVL